MPNDVDHEPTYIPLIALAFCAFLLWLGFNYSPADRHFWYPVKLVNAKCSAFQGEAYVMANSIGWRSWPYFVDRATKRELTLGDDCTLITVRDLPHHEWQPQNLLTPEQREFVIEGF